MPAYDYLCLTCGAVTEIRASFAEKDAGITPQCQQCKSEELRRTFSTVNVMAGGGPASPPQGAGGGGGCCGGGCCG